MRKALMAVAAVASLAAATLAAPAPADARCRGCGVAAGAIGGLAAGAIIGGAIANAQPRYDRPARGYVVYDSYYEPPLYGCPGGYWARRPVAFDRCGRPIRWSRPRFICP